MIEKIFMNKIYIGERLGFTSRNTQSTLSGDGLKYSVLPLHSQYALHFSITGIEMNNRQADHFKNNSIHCMSKDILTV